MAKSPVRQQDTVISPSLGNGSVITGDTSVTFQGQPIACADDRVIFADGTKGVIQEGKACVVVNGKRVALVGDQTQPDGVIQTGANTIQVDEGEPFVFIGPNVSIGKNVIFSCAPQTGFDEAIQFTDEEGNPLGKIFYQLTVGGDSDNYQGITDDNSITMRVKTAQPQPITKALIRPVAPFCCAASLANMGSPEPIAVDIDGVQTNPEQLGKSIVKKSARTKRPMTAGEIAMCQLIFKDAINYSKVKIHKGGFMWGAGDNAMTPFGQPHFPVLKDGRGYQEDFSHMELIDMQDIQVWFIHEMVHVWQYQMGYGVALHGVLISLKGGYKNNNYYLPPRAYRYDYSQDPETKKFSDFNMEQQANIVAYYYAVEFLASINRIYTDSYPFNRVVLREFLINPNNKSLLPHTTHF